MGGTFLVPGGWESSDEMGHMTVDGATWRHQVHSHSGLTALRARAALIHQWLQDFPPSQAVGI